MFTAARKVVFPRTLKTADWANTTIASGDLAEEVYKLRRGGDGYIIVSGGNSFWRSLARLDVIDEYRVILVPYHKRTGGTPGVQRPSYWLLVRPSEACTALVTSSETTRPTGSVNASSPHSHST